MLKLTASVTVSLHAVVQVSSAGTKYLSPGIRGGWKLETKRQDVRECCCELVGKSLPLFSKTDLKKNGGTPMPMFHAMLAPADRLVAGVVVACVWEPGCSF